MNESARSPNQLPNVSELRVLKEQSIGTLNKNTLIDIQNITIDTRLPLPERLAAFLHQIKNPYAFRYKDRVVRVSYADTDVTFEERVKNYFEML